MSFIYKSQLDVMFYYTEIGNSIIIFSHTLLIV